jgi:hypothetical protein
MTIARMGKIRSKPGGLDNTATARKSILGRMARLLKKYHDSKVNSMKSPSE